jgi:hypothetical protein
MDNAARHIMLQLEILLKEYPEAQYYVQNQIKQVIGEVLNSEDYQKELLEVER